MNPPQTPTPQRLKSVPVVRLVRAARCVVASIHKRAQARPRDAKDVTVLPVPLAAAPSAGGGLTHPIGQTAG
jgi:hypothetical protein